jgi:Sigma-70, region 4/Bacterial RNA polymerase, alpha chain C terminal domain
MHVTELGLSPAALACLEAAGLTDVEQLATHPADDLINSGHFAATELYEIICRLNRHGLSLPTLPGRRGRVPNARNRKMLRLRLIDGLSLTEIGKQTGVSQERVRQLLWLHFGLSGTRRWPDKR